MEDFKVCMFLVQLGDEVYEQFILCTESFIPTLDQVCIPDMHYNESYDDDYQFSLN